MMSLATLPLSFRDYALESDACILNMVPTKKVDKTPYELWHGKVPNLSYLKNTLRKLWVTIYTTHLKKIVVKRYANFLEKDFILQKESGRIVELEDEYILPSENTSEHPIEEESLALIFSQEENAILVRRSVRTHKAPDRLCPNVEIDPDRQCINVEVEEHSLGDLNEPANYKAALSDPKFEKLLVAMNAEMQSMYDNKVWRLVVLPPNVKVVKSKWIYKKNTNIDGKETFSPVADIRAIRILIAIAAYYGYEIWKMDVKTAFLNGFLEVEIYIEQPEGFIDPNHPRKGYLGEVAFILGIKIYRDRSRRLIGLSQNAYLDKILKRYRMDNSKRSSIPMQVDLHLSKSQCVTTSAEMKHIQNVPYALAVGSIMYVVRCTRPDVAFTQNITSRFQQNSSEAHWTAMKNNLKYLRNTKVTFLVYGGDPKVELRVNCYCDAGFETDKDETKSQTGYVFVLNRGVMVWKSSKQSTTAQHATKAEYIATSEAAKEVVWIRKFIDELGVVASNDYPIKLNCDNSIAIIMAKESRIQKYARHFKRKYQYVRECIETGKIDIVKVHTNDNLVDPFTKDLASPKLTRHARSMGLRPASSFM
nr:retrotransposon protein, putative, Ty1-copia subclass [Tanacetum cinerariifolium]